MAQRSSAEGNCGQVGLCHLVYPCRYVNREPPWRKIRPKAHRTSRLCRNQERRQIFWIRYSDALDHRAAADSWWRRLPAPIAEGRIIHINLGRAFEISDMSAKILVIAQRAGWQMRWAKVSAFARRLRMRRAFRAALRLDLHRDVINLEGLGGAQTHSADDGVVVVAIGELNVDAHRVFVGGQGPDADRGSPGCRAAPRGGHAGACRSISSGSLPEHRRRFAQQADAARQHEQGEPSRDQRVGVVPARPTSARRQRARPASRARRRGVRSRRRAGSGSDRRHRAAPTGRWR